MAFQKAKAISKIKVIGSILESKNAEIEFVFASELVLYDRASGQYFKLKKVVNKVDNVFEVDLGNKEQVEYLGKD